MNEFGPTSGTRGRGAGPVGGAGGSPPTVLIAALGAAALIAATLVALLLSSGGGDPVPVGGPGVDNPNASSATPNRVLLTVQVEGGGTGRVHIEPRGVACSDTCEHDLATGTRVSLTADAAKGSRFDGWSDSCTGKDRCSFVMDRARSITAAFEAQPAVSQCDDGRDNDGDGLVDASDPGCGADDTEAPDDRAQGALECTDGRDNDGDGLVDRAQDPGCAADGTEADTAAPQTTPTSPSPTPTPTTSSPVSECRDGRDNDGDGLVDRPADPGCDADGSETGPP
jgi:Divergent InlB B-repeat domain